MALGPAEIVLILGVLLLPILAGMIVRLVALIHCLVRDDLGGTQKLIWALLIFFVPFAQFVYLFMGRERTRRAFADVGQPPRAVEAPGAR